MISVHQAFDDTPCDHRLAQTHLIGDEKATNMPTSIKGSERTLYRRLLKGLRCAHDTVLPR